MVKKLIKETVNCLKAVIEYEENFKPGGERLEDYAIKYKVKDDEELKRVSQIYTLEEAKILLEKYNKGEHK